MDVLRTPDDRFEGLEGFDFTPHYAEVPADPLTPSAEVLRMHYLDERPGAGDGDDVVLCLHGEPSWSYLYRSMVPPMVSAGLRVVAPDLVGFGRSDKPASREDYTYERHVGWLSSLVFDALDLTGITLVCQDWGGLLGLRLVAAEPERFARVVAANTFLPSGERQLPDAFRRWRQFSQEVEDFDVGSIVAAGTADGLSPAARAAYDAPFPTDAYKEGARQFPMLVPDGPDAPSAAQARAAWEVLRGFDRPFLTAFSDGDPITAGSDRYLREQIPGAANQPHVTIEGGGHFLQEDRGVELATVITDFVAATP
jgi:haloalkane dehalogenase